MSSNYLIQDMPLSERPREKLERYGVEELSNEELLAIILATGTKSKSAIELARSLLIHMEGAHGMANAGLNDLMEVSGIGKAKASTIIAALEFGKRIMMKDAEKKISLASPKTIYEYMKHKLRYETQEKFFSLLLDVKCNLIGEEEVSRGGLDFTIVDPKILFKKVISKQASSIILVHNHPSGDPHPSQADKSLTHQIIEGAKLLGIKVMDHVIIGEDSYFSFEEQGILR